MSNLWIEPSELGDQKDSEFAAEATQAASYLLWALSGRKFSGVTIVTERYVRTVSSGIFGLSAQTTQVALAHGEAVNVRMGGEEMLSPLSRIRLRGRPVTAIHSIRLATGKVVPPSDYYMVDHSTIQFSNGALWNPYNLEITYAYGSPPPIAGKMAARILARELIKSWEGASDCALPARVTSVTRQGVMYTLLDDQTFIDQMKTGLYEVDLFLKTANPTKALARSRVFSPDVPRARKYNPKSPELATGARDLAIKVGTTRAATIPLSAVDGGFLLPDSGWSLEITLHSYGSVRSITLDPTFAQLDADAETITVAIPYSSAVSVLRMVDPGTWDLYAVKGDATTYLTSGNLRIDLT